MLRTSGTAGEAMNAIGEATGISDRSRQLSLLNDMRQWVISQQSSLGIEIITPLCVPVTPMRVPCSNRCSDRWVKGFRLPFHYSGVVGVEYNQVPLDVWSKRRTPYDGLTFGLPFDGSQGLAIIRGDNNPLEFDIEKDTRLRITYKAKNGCNPDFSFTAKGYNPAGELQEEQINFTESTTIQTESWWKEIVDLRFIGRLQGKLTIETEDGCFLSDFSNGDSPGFVTYTIHPRTCGATKLRVEAHLSYKPVTDESDLVEFGNTLAWQLLAKYIHNLLKDKRDGAETNQMEMWRMNFINMMLGEQDLEQGDIVSVFQRQSVDGGFTGLPSQRRRRGV